MDKEKYDIDLIEKYLSDGMDEGEKARFEKEMEADPVLKEEVALHRDILAGIDFQFDEELKQKLLSAEKEIRIEKGNAPSVRYLRWPIGIAASLLIIVLGFYLFRQGPSAHEDVFISYYEPYPNVLSGRERSGEGSAKAGDAMDYYEDEDYAAAKEAFEADPEALSTQPAFKFYYAISCLSTDNPREAIPPLRELANMEGHILNQQARWYLGLAYLKAGELGKARETFDEIQNSESSFSIKAQDILQELD